MKRLAIYDFDGTLMNSPEKAEGIPQWEKVRGEKYPHKGWWGRPESLDTDVFDIKPHPEILNRLKSDMNAADTHVIILTSRQDKLRPELENILNLNSIHVDELVTKRGAADKGDVIMKYVNNNPDLKYIVAYDDFAGGMQEKINEYTKIIEDLKQRGIQYNVIRVVDGRISNMVESSNILMHMIEEEILKFKNQYLFHGTSVGAALSIQRDGKMKINQAIGSQSNSPDSYISFSSKYNVASQYAYYKGGIKGVILRTKLTDDFKLSPKYINNDGYEWITTKEIPISELEIKTREGFIPLIDWNPY